MTTRSIPIIVTLLCLSLGAVAQKPTPTPTPVYKNYAEAMAAGKAAIEPSARDIAADAFNQASELASGDVQKANALIEAGKVQTKNYHMASTSGKYKSTSFTVHHHSEALRLLNAALELPGVDDAKRAEIKVLRVDVYLAAMREADSRNNLAKELEAKFGKSLRWVIRDEMSTLAGAQSTPPDFKARAQIQIARSFEGPFGAFTNQSDMTSAFQVLVKAADVAEAADRIKADALLQAAEIGRTAKDINILAGAYERVTKLPKAEATQKFTAFTGLADLLIGNDRFADARQQLSDALAVPGLSLEEKSGIYRQNALSFIVEMLATKEAKQADALMASARADFAKVANQPKLTADEKTAAYVGNATYIRRFTGPKFSEAAHDQLKAALAVPKTSEKAKAIAQYEVGETFRLEKKTAEARAAYLLVSKADGQYHNYAQQRIKELDKPTQ